MHRLLLLVLICWASAARAAEHVIVVIWDGLRPDAINETDTPTLAALARDGVFFANHRAVFLSSTIVNGAAIATGCYPAHNGTFANTEYRPTLNPLAPGSTATPGAVKTMAVPTVSEILQRAGRRTAIVGSKSVALVHDHQPRADTPDACVNLIEGRDGLPPEQIQRLLRKVGRPAFESKAKDDWSTHALIGQLWDAGIPAYSLLWLAEPDATQRTTGPGSVESRAALRNSDHNLARLLAELESRNARDKTAILVVSDHGFSTVSRTVDIAGALRHAGFNASRAFTEQPGTNDIVVAGNGTAAALYVIGRSPDTTRRVVEFLQQQDYPGVILTREPVPGTFTTDQARCHTPAGADIIISLRWTAEKSATGVPGLIISDGGPSGSARGAHGSLSRYDLHNTLIAAGPGFARGVTNSLPSSNADIAPTVLHLLGVKPPQPMDGRILTIEPPGQQPVSSTLIATNGAWRQYLRVTTYAGAFYLDEGNAGAP